jgi:hypothetical protein
MSNFNIVIFFDVVVSFDVASNVASTKEKLMIKLKNIHDYESKAKQLKIIICLLNERNIILFAKTKYEKSMILYSSSTLQMNTIILLIMSLNALQKNQKNFIKKMNSNINACVFNEKTITKKLLIEIKYEIYIHILINSKFVLFNDSFREVLQNFSFRERLILAVIDTSRNDSVPNRTNRFGSNFWNQTESNRKLKNQTIEISIRFGSCRFETDRNRRKDSTKSDS